MKKDVIFEVLGLLKKHRLVDNESEFSIYWLGQCESYYRGLRFRNKEPSLGVIAVCASRLERAGREMVTSPRYQHVGLKFLAMSEKCHQLVNEEAVELELIS